MSDEQPDAAQGVITVEQAETLRQQALKNIVDKIAAGGVPSAREQALLDASTSRKAEAPKTRRKIHDIPEALTSSMILAGFLDVDEKTIRNLAARREIAGVSEDGTWPFQENVVSYIRLLREEAKGFPAQTARVRHAQAETDLENAQIDQALKKGGLIPREEYEARWTDGIIQIRQTIDAATFLTAPQKKKLLAQLKKVALAKLAGKELKRTP